MKFIWLLTGLAAVSMAIHPPAIAGKEGKIPVPVPAEANGKRAFSILEDVEKGRREKEQAARAGLTIGGVMERMRTEVPLYYGMDYGEAWEDPHKVRWGLARLRQAGCELTVRDLNEVMILVSYLRDSDPRLQFMAAVRLKELCGAGHIELHSLVGPEPVSDPPCIPQITAALARAVKKGTLLYDK